jgi:serine/threonine protein kinase
MFLVRFCIKLVYLLHATLWYLLKYPKFKRKLEKEYQLRELSVVNFTKWRQGSFYFKGLIGSSKVFIKTDFWLGLIKNEKLCDDLFSSDGCKHLISPLRLCDEDFAVYDYMDGVTLDIYLLNEHLSSADLALLEVKIHELLDLLYKHKIVHRDFTPRNIFITKKNELIAIDFFFATSSSNPNFFTDIEKSNFVHMQLLKKLGVQKKLYVWDDAYSMVQGLKAIQAQSDLNISGILKGLEKKIGRLEYCYADRIN